MIPPLSTYVERGRGGEAVRAAMLALAVSACAPHHLVPVSPAATTDLLERCHQLYLAAGSDGPKLLAVDAVIVDSTTNPPLRCGPLRSAHPRLKSSE